MEDIDRSAACPAETEEKQKVQRLHRIQQYQTETLHKSDPIEAVVGAATGELMRTQMRVEEVLAACLERRLDTAEGFKAVFPVLDSQLRLARQVERQINLMQRLRDKNS